MKIKTLEKIVIAEIILFLGLIVLSIKLIITMNKIENVVDDISNKVDSLNGLFSIIDFTTDKLAMISEKVTNGITLFIKLLCASLMVNSH